MIIIDTVPSVIVFTHELDLSEHQRDITSSVEESPDNLSVEFVNNTIRFMFNDTELVPIGRIFDLLDILVDAGLESCIPSNIIEFSVSFKETHILLSPII